MSNYLQYKYISLLSGQLENFKKKNDSLYNFRCNICGDSKRNHRKARAYLYEKDGEFWFHCHKCGYSTHFEPFLKDQNQQLFNEYLKEKLYKPKDEEKHLEEQTTVFKKLSTFVDLPSVSSLPYVHPVKQYVIGRKIPETYWSQLFYAENFKGFCNSYIPGKFNTNSLKYEEARLVIPFLTEDKKLFGFTGRSLDPSNILRYINTYLDNNILKVYGLDRLDWNKTIYVVEGPIDSMFLPNCIATSGNDMVAALKGLDKDKFILCYDNETRSRTTIAKIKKAIDNDYKVCIWPHYFVTEKDINAMILNGKSEDEIVKLINDNTFQGLRATLELGLRYSV